METYGERLPDDWALETADRMAKGGMSNYMVPQANRYINLIIRGLNLNNVLVAKSAGALSGGLFVYKKGFTEYNAEASLDNLAKLFLLKEPCTLAMEILSCSLVIIPFTSVVDGKGHLSLLFILNSVNSDDAIERTVAHWCPSGMPVSQYKPWLEGLSSALRESKLPLAQKLREVIDRPAVNLNSIRFQEVEPPHGGKNPLDIACGFMAFDMMRMVLQNVAKSNSSGKSLSPLKVLQETQVQFAKKMRSIIIDDHADSVSFKFENMVQNAGFRYKPYTKKRSAPLSWC